MERGITIFTCLFGDYDRLRIPKVDGRFICYTDQTKKCHPWEMLRVPVQLPNAKEVRRYKLLAHRYVATEFSIYIDANIELHIAPEEAIERWLGDADIAVHRHPDRDCLYSEASTCIAMGKAKAEDLLPQVDKYSREGYPKHNGLYECGVILRRNTTRMAELNEIWWAEVEKHSARDQISFPFVLWKLGIEPKVISGMCQRNAFFVWRPHGS